ncbi:MAG: DUF1127 domain-containing protein [Alphaproteobacteria bacterium]|nr:DUF1127 domain-containing protein [Alphaproteobacteria bacterium]
MLTNTQTHHPLTTGAELSAPKSVLARLVADVRRYFKARRTYRELMDLDDRSLKDIGITRGDIRRIAFGEHGREGHELRRVPDGAGSRWITA